MSGKYQKPPLSLDECTEWFAVRGVSIELKDRLDFERFLKSETIFKVMGYLKPLKGKKIDYRDLEKIYFFDRELRNVFLEAFEVVEVQLRNAIVNFISEKEKHGPFAYEKKEIFGRRLQTTHAEWLAKIRENVCRRTQESFIRYYKENYEDFPHLPIWALFEIFSFHELKEFYLDLSKLNKVAIAHDYGLKEEIFSSWLRNFVELRNACAHQHILYGRTLSMNHLTVTPGVVPENSVAAALLSLFEYFGRGCGIKDRNSGFMSKWKKRVKDMFAEYGRTPHLLSGYGFPEGFVIK